MTIIKATFAALGGLLPALALADPPSLYLAHRSQDAAQVQLLKAQLGVCVSEKQALQHAQRTQPDTFAQMLREVRSSRPAYDVDRPLAPPPDWSRVAVEEEEEYFAQTRYALYRRAARYAVSEDGACALRETKIETATIDDGATLYEIDLLARTGTRRPSVAKGPADPRVARATRAIDVRALAAQVQSLWETVGQDRVAGERCDYVVFAAAQRARVCLWSELSHYPGSARRPVILKSIVPVGKVQVTREATAFRRDARVDPARFVPPPGIAWRSR